MEQTLSHYEINNNLAFQQLMIAIQDTDKLIENQDYIIVERNSTYDYTYGFTVTSDGVWSDECFKEGCDTAYECALKHKGDRYVVVLAKLDNNQLRLIKEYNVIK